jgi:hypothetical protein
VWKKAAGVYLKVISQEGLRETTKISARLVGSRSENRARDLMNMKKYKLIFNTT